VNLHLPGKRLQWIGLGLILAASLAIALTLIPAPATSKAGSTATVSAATARVVRTTLLDTHTETGTLGFGDPVDVPFISNERSGIVTWMAPEGSIVSRGEPLFAIDGQPVILFYGLLPVFRTLRFDNESLADFEWLELNNAQDDERKAELNLALQRARLAEAQVRLDDTKTHMEDSARDTPITPQFVRLAQAIAAARDKLHRVEQLRASGFTTPAEVEQAQYELAAAQAERDAAGRERVQQFATASTAVADAQLAVHGAERTLRDAQDVRNALLSSANANADIDLLQENLHALGYDGAAASAIRNLQTDTGRSATGLIEPGQIVVAAGPVRVAAHLAEVGDVVFSGQSGQSGLAPGNDGSDPILRYTGTNRTVTVSLTIADHDYARPGDPVVVTLPTDVEVQGVIAEVSTIFDDEGLAATEIEIPDQSALGTLEAASVDVEFVIGKREDVLAVPIAALLALPEGGFGVEIVDGHTSRIVPVDTGLFANGNVEISGADIAEGLMVGVAR
jgi:hypothetical protein